VYTHGRRLKNVRYPNGRLVHYRYGAEGGRDDMISRLATIHDDSGGLPGQALASYAYSGLGRLAVEEFPQPEVRLDYFQGTSGAYAGFDRFGRTKDQRWRFTGQTPADRDRYRYGYDYASNRLWRENALTHGTANQFDEAYTHDGLHRLQDAARGTLDDPPSEGLLAKTFEQAWGLDQVGNWPSFKEGDGTTWSLEQERDHNTVNEIMDITEGQGQSQWVTPAWDARGNMTSGPKPGAETSRQHFVWDAWNRLVKVHADDGQGGQGDLVATYSYDGTRRRIRRAVEGAPDVAYDYFYSGYQAVEVRKDSSASPYEQYVWGARYIDAPVVRDRDADGQSGNGLEERLYYTTDANMNVTALVAADGSAVERYAYSPYGQVSFLAPDWGARNGSAYANEVLYCGYRFDPETGLYHVRHRYYHPTLGRWVARDPTGPSRSAYEYIRSDPISGADPKGLAKFDKLWKMYHTDDVGTPYQKQLMRHFALGGGVPFKRGTYWQHAGLERMFAYTLVQYESVGIGPRSGEWASFMMARPELQAEGRRFFRNKATEVGRERSMLVNQHFSDEAAPVRLTELQSMVNSLHGSEAIKVEGLWSRCEVTGGSVRVDFKYLTWRWLDHGDLHPRTLTVQPDGEAIDDADLDLGTPYPIEISWAVIGSTWQVSPGGVAMQESGDWPPIQVHAPAPPNGGTGPRG
jgi:RHS repeat-associated protein